LLLLLEILYATARLQVVEEKRLASKTSKQSATTKTETKTQDQKANVRLRA